MQRVLVDVLNRTFEFDESKISRDERGRFGGKDGEPGEFLAADKVRTSADGAATLAKLEPLGQAWQSSLPEHERVAVDRYDHGHGRDMNRVLRDEPTQTVHDRPLLDKLIVDMQAALTKAPPLDEPVIAYRGLKIPGPEHEALAALGFVRGGTVEFEAFTSTSVDPARAADYAVSQQSAIMMEIKTSAGSFWPDAPDSPGPERELMLPDGSQFRVLGVDRDVPYRGSDGEDRPMTVVRLEHLREDQARTAAATLVWFEFDESKVSRDEKGRFGEKDGDAEAGEPSGFLPADQAREMVPESRARLESAGRVWVNSLSADEKAGLKTYVGMGALQRPINESLRGEPLDLKLQTEVDQAIIQIDSALAKAAPLDEPVLVYRTVGKTDPDAWLAEHPPGATVQFDNYSSTTLNPAWAASFARDSLGTGRGIVFEIQTQSGAYIPDIGVSKVSFLGLAEQELLLPRDSEFRVAGVQRDVLLTIPPLPLQRERGMDPDRTYTVVQLEHLPKERR